MPRDRRAYLVDVLLATDLISEFVHGKTLDAYRTDALLRSGVERQFTIIGEALSQLRQIDPGLAGRVPELREIIGFRNILVHGYSGLDDEQVWYSVGDLARLRAAVKGLLDELNG